MLDNVKRFKNGNMNVKMDQDFYDEKESAIVNLLNSLEDNDCIMFGEEFCLSNYDCGIYVYSYYTDKKYLISFYDVENIYKAGKTLKLYAANLDQEDREMLEKEDY